MPKHQLVVYENPTSVQLTYEGRKEIRTVTLFVDGVEFERLRERATFDYKEGFFWQKALEAHINHIAEVFDCEIVYDGDESTQYKR